MQRADTGHSLGGERLLRLLGRSSLAGLVWVVSQAALAQAGEPQQRVVEAAPPQAVSASGLGLHLTGAFQAAAQYDPAARAAKARWQAQQELLPIATGRLRPSLALSSSRLWVNQDRQDGNAPEQNQRYPSKTDSLSLRQALYQGRALAEQDQAQALLQAAQARWQFDQQALVVRLARAYFAVLLQQERSLLAQSQLQSVASQRKAAEMALQSGAGTRTELDELEAQLELVEADRLKAEQAATLAVLELQAMTGLPESQLASLWNLDAQRFDPQQLAPKTSMIELLDSVAQRSPLATESRAQVDAAAALAKAATADRKPSLDLLLQASQSEGENSFFVTSRTTSRAVGLQLSVPLYQGGAEFARERQAAANLLEAQAKHDQVLATAQASARRLYFALQEGAQRLRALERAFTSAQQLVRASQRGFEAGRRTRLDILAAQQRLTELGLELANVRFQFLTDWLELQAEQGAATPQSLEQLNQLLRPELGP